MKKFVDVILPLPLPRYFTYSLPEEWADEVQMGCRVVVSFGRKKYYTAIVRNVHYCEPADYEVKEVSALLDAHPILLPEQFKFWEWLADYYLCTQGDVYKAALPSGLKLESETMVEYNPDFESEVRLPEREQKILDLLSAEPEQCVTKLEKDSGLKNILSVIKSLLDKEAIFVKEELRRTYKPKTETRVRLADEVRNEKRLQELFDELARAPKQLDLLMKYIELSGILGGDGLKSFPKEVNKKELLLRASASPAVFNGLVDKHIFEVYQQEVGRLNSVLREILPINPLNEHQQMAHDEIVRSFQSKNVCLLHGVTASGKTEIYIHLIEEAVRQGKQVLYLLPEIALTTQITERLQRVFGDRLGIYHSKFPDAERVEIWQKQLTEKGYDIILGVRSSVFLPFRNLGLVIVDEEHENTYKQQDPAPRYHARNAAIILAAMYGAKTLLGTATPSIETWHNASSGKYGLVELKERYKEIQLPEIIPVDIHELHRKKRMNGPFSPLLLQYIHEALDQKQQVILFQNRRGFAPMIECNTCGWVPKCKNCDVSLTYYKQRHVLVCRYCGAMVSMSDRCSVCGEGHYRERTPGTERIEEEVLWLFPQARVARMDLDVMSSKSRFRSVIEDFEQGKTDILIGTQMVTKGLDFANVKLVGVIDADSMVNFPDFRAEERVYCMLLQVSGRSGRKGDRGKVVIQAADVKNRVYTMLTDGNYRTFFEQLAAERELFVYPPFGRMIQVELRHKEVVPLRNAANRLAVRLRGQLGKRVCGPAVPEISKIGGYHRLILLLKLENGISCSGVKNRLREEIRILKQEKQWGTLRVICDVDPQ